MGLAIVFGGTMLYGLGKAFTLAGSAIGDFRGAVLWAAGSVQSLARVGSLLLSPFRAVASVCGGAVFSHWPIARVAGILRPGRRYRTRSFLGYECRDEGPFGDRKRLDLLGGGCCQGAPGGRFSASIPIWTSSIATVGAGLGNALRGRFSLAWSVAKPVLAVIGRETAAVSESSLAA